MTAVRLTIFVCVISCTGFTQDTTRLTLLFLGDIMQHDSQLLSAYNSTTGKYNYEPCFRHVKKYFQSADLTIGNLELTLGGKPYKGYPEFSAPDALAASLKDAGVDVLVTANNHSLDRRRKGLERTIRVLDSLNILHTGTFRDTVERMNDYPLIISKNGFNLALLNYTYGTNGIPVTKPNIVNLIDTAVIRKDLHHAQKLKPDLIIVFFHWGNEYQSQPSKQQKQLAEFCFSNGAGLVIGAHPHVLQPMEWRKDKHQVVVYSLGNFISGQRVRYRDGAAMVRIDLTKIYFSDSLSTVAVAGAGYILHWVYKSPPPQQNFTVLPVPDFETDSTGFIRDEPSQLAFRRFVDDARILLNHQTAAVPELTNPAADSTWFYRVSWTVPATEKDWASMLRPGDFRFGIELKSDDLGNLTAITGNFVNRKNAERYLAQIQEIYPQARLVVFSNDRLYDVPEKN